MSGDGAASRRDAARGAGGRTAYFDVLRVVAIVGVVVLHTAAQQWYATPPASVSWQTLNVYDSAMRFCVPIFFMVSGALFLDQARRVDLGTILRKSLPRLLVAFAVWSVFYALINTFVFGSYAGMRDLLGKMVVGYYHQWFLWALMGLYLVTPLLRRICAERALAVYFVVLAFVFASVLPLLTQLPVVGTAVSAITGMAQVQLVLGYSMYFVLGHLIHTGVLDGVRMLWFVVAGISAVVVTASGAALLSLRAGEGDVTLYGYLTPNVVVASICVFVVVKRLVEGGKNPGKVGRVTAFVGASSFGIYLVHPFFQSLLISAGVTTAVLPEIVSVPLVALAIFVPSLLVAALLHRIPRVGRYIA